MLLCVTSLSRPVVGLFEGFSIDFAWPFPMPYIGRPEYLLVCVEHLTNWPTVRATPDEMAGTVFGFRHKEALHSYGPPRMKVNDKASCFTAQTLVDFVKIIGMNWKPVPFPVPMSNRNAEGMVDTIKKSTSRLVEGNPEAWHKHYMQAVHGYHSRSLGTWKSLLELLHGVRPRIVGKAVPFAIATTVADQHVEDMILD